MKGLRWGVVVGLAVLVLLWVDSIWQAVPSGHEPKRYKLSRQQLTMITLAMDAEGYNCPRAKDFATCGGSGDDRILRIWCGPDDGSDEVDERLLYRVTFRNDYATVRKWPGDPHECP